MSNNGVHLGFEQKLWKAADKLRSNMDTAKYKHVVLGSIFLKYISDSFDERHEQLQELVREGAERVQTPKTVMNIAWKTYSGFPITQDGVICKRTLNSQR